MKNALLAILLCGVAVAACDARREQAEAAPEAAVAIQIDEKDAAELGKSSVSLRADMESGEVEMKLPGGIEGKVNLPEGLEPDARFDLDGVGRYPGATLTSVNVNAGRDGDGKRGVVVLGFAAPGSADAVADWYEQALAGKGRNPRRDGTTITARTRDGDTMVLAIRDGDGGKARGIITITSRKG